MVGRLKNSGGTIGIGCRCIIGLKGVGRERLFGSGGIESANWFPPEIVYT